LVGEKTGGEVLAGSVHPLIDGGLLYLAVADVWVDGERLEGRGVSPDVEVKDELRYANGADPQLARALQIAAEKVKPL
jgi:carboxyl-terminal processing protease